MRCRGGGTRGLASRCPCIMTVEDRMQTETQKSDSAATARVSEGDLPVVSGRKSTAQPASPRRIRPIVPNVFRAPN